jgi:hypothetical protein
VKPVAKMQSCRSSWIVYFLSKTLHSFSYVLVYVLILIVESLFRFIERKVVVERIEVEGVEVKEVQVEVRSPP